MGCDRQDDDFDDWAMRKYKRERKDVDMKTQNVIVAAQQIEEINIRQTGVYFKFFSWQGKELVERADQVNDILNRLSKSSKVKVYEPSTFNKNTVIVFNYSVYRVEIVLKGGAE